jgi:ribokinase
MLYVVGSINLDLIGTVPSLPRPGETVSGSAYATAPGGKGANQALAARRAGAAVRMVGAVGDDANAAAALGLLRADGVVLDTMHRTDAPTGVALILVDGHGENMIAVIAGANGTLDADTVERALAGMGAGDMLLVQQEISQIGTEAAMRLARAKGAMVMFNPAPVQPDSADLLVFADLVVTNRTEFDTLFPGDGVLEARLSAAAAHGGQTLIVTLGGDGVLAATPDALMRLPAHPVTPVDTVGAGDTFCGYLAAGLAAGLPLDQALARANVAGALACLTPGAQPAIPYAEAVDAALSGQ